jgi:hypothetical protein
MKLPMSTENMATPSMSMPDPHNLSKLDLGVKSPKPTVAKVVNAKYSPMMVFLLASFCLRLYKSMKFSCSEAEISLSGSF